MASPAPAGTSRSLYLIALLCDDDGLRRSLATGNRVRHGER